VPTAAEVPITRAMLSEVRTELLERIDQAKHELKAEIHGLKGEVHEVKAGLHQVEARLHGVEAGLHGMRAEMARMATLLEEQNSRNKVVLDALVSVLDRQDRVERRMGKVEDTVLGLAAAHPPA